MTTEARPTAERAALEGTLGDLALFEVLGLLACGHQTGTLYLAGSRPAAITWSTARCRSRPTIRAVRCAKSCSAGGSSPRTTGTRRSGTRDTELGNALVAESGAQVGELRDAVHEHIVATVYDLTDLVDGRFRFVLGSRHSMGQGYAYPVSVLSGDVAARSEAWRSINDLVPHTAVIAQLNDTAPDGDTTVCIAAADWPVVVALDGQRPLRDLVGPTRMTSFAICEAVHRLITAGLVTVIDDGSY